MSKIFIGSTVFDLLDARAEVEQLLRDMRLVPVLSGSGASGFQPLPDQNSIETCLANLRQCDAVVVILCQRYGPSLSPAGFPDVSATHLEYNEAKKFGKPIHMYVRDRLEADYAIVKKNKPDIQLSWVREQHDRKLFDFLAEHRKLASDQPGSNWFDTFTDSIQLKTLIRRDFRPIAARNELEALIVENRVPIISVEVDMEPAPGAGPFAISIRIRIKNVGTVPAYRLSWTFDDQQQDHSEMPVLAPQQETIQSLVYGYEGKSWELDLTINYFIPQGHRVCDEYRVEIRPMGGKLFASGATCRAKTYYLASGDVQPFVISDAKEASLPTRRVSESS